MHTSKLISQMSIEQKVGQMFLVSFIGAQKNSKMTEFLKQGSFGNVLIYGDNIQNASQLKELTYDLNTLIKRNTGIPPFIAVDHEGGNVIRLHDEVTAFPSSMAFAAAQAQDKCYQLGQCMAEELLALGINVNFAPVLDINNNALNPIINSRAFSDTPQQVYEYARNLVNGMQENGLLACGKHFPGHGDTSVDSHFGLPKVTKNKQDILNNELYPFIKCFNSGLDSVMTAHIIFSSLEPKNIPATMSKNILTDLLRTEIGFKGLIFSDSMQMAAIKKFYGIPKASVEAVKAGVDIILSGINNNDDETNSSQLEGYNAVVEAVKKGDIAINTINKAVERILSYKHKYKLFQEQQKQVVPNLAKNLGFAQQISEKAITLVKDEQNLLPIVNERVLIISASTTKPLGGLALQSVNQNTFAYKVATALNGDYKIVAMKPTKQQISEIINTAHNYSRVIYASNNANVYPEQIELINDLMQVKAKLIVVATCSPYDIIHFPQVPTYICTYDYNSTTVNSLNKLLTGTINFKGKLPVNIKLN